MNVTDDVVQHFATLLDQADAPEGTVIRLVVEQQDVRLQADRPRGNDITYDHEGRPVFAVDESTANTLSGRELAIETSGEKPQVTLRAASGT